MRTQLIDLPTAHPIGDLLPGIYSDDDFTQRFTAAFDAVLAPVFLVLDGFPAYLDPDLAPEDFLDWLADWVALELDEGWTLSQRRQLIRHAVELHRRRGTRRGLAAHVRLLTGGEVELTDSGGCSTSDTANGPLPGSSPPQILVRVRVADPAAVDRRRLRTAVIEAVPAHIRVSIEVLPTGEGDQA
jgi:phage tail-like protein